MIKMYNMFEIISDVKKYTEHLLNKINTSACKYTSAKNIEYKETIFM